MQEVKIIKNIFPCEFVEMVDSKNSALLTMNDVNVGFCLESSIMGVLDNVSFTINREKYSDLWERVVRVRP